MEIIELLNIMIFANMITKMVQKPKIYFLENIFVQSAERDNITQF